MSRDFWCQILYIFLVLLHYFWVLLACSKATFYEIKYSTVLLKNIVIRLCFPIVTTMLKTKRSWNKIKVELKWQNKKDVSDRDHFITVAGMRAYSFTEKVLHHRCFLVNFFLIKVEAVVRRCFVNKVFLKISQNSQENISRNL